MLALFDIFSAVASSELYTGFLCSLKELFKTRIAYFYYA